MQKGLGMTY